MSRTEFHRESRIKLSEELKTQQLYYDNAQVELAEARRFCEDDRPYIKILTRIEKNIRELEKAIMIAYSAKAEAKED